MKYTSDRQPCMAVAAGHRIVVLRTLLDLPVVYQVVGVLLCYVMSDLATDCFIRVLLEPRTLCL